MEFVADSGGAGAGGGILGPATAGRRQGRWRWAMAAAAIAVGLGLSACQTDAGGMTNALAMQQLAREPMDAEPWTFNHSPGLLISTEHYRIYTTIRDPLYQRLLGKILEATYDRAQQFRPSHRVSEPMECYVFGDRSQWELYTKLRGGNNAPIYLAISAGGYCQNGVFAGYDLPRGRQETLSVIAHEAWHQYSWFAFKDRLPSWLEEGLATQNESFEWNGVTPSFTPELNYRRYQALQGALKDPRSMWNLERLLSTHAGQVIKVKQSDRDVANYYAQLWALILFLQNGKYAGGMTRILVDAEEGRLAASLQGSGVTPREIADFTEKWNTVAGPKYMRTYVNQDLRQLEQEYLQFCKELVSTWPPKIR